MHDSVVSTAGDHLGEWECQGHHLGMAGASSGTSSGACLGQHLGHIVNIGQQSAMRFCNPELWNTEEFIVISGDNWTGFGFSCLSLFSSVPVGLQQWLVGGLGDTLRWDTTHFASLGNALACSWGPLQQLEGWPYLTQMWQFFGQQKMGSYSRLNTFMHQSLNYSRGWEYQLLHLMCHNDIKCISKSAISYIFLLHIVEAN